MVYIPHVAMSFARQYVYYVERDMLIRIHIYMVCIFFISAEKRACNGLGLRDPPLVLSISVLHC